MTESEIYFQYNSAVKQAEKLDEIAGKLQKIAADRMEGTQKRKKNVWQSDNSPQYYQKAGQVQEDLSSTASQIQKIADGIRTIAESVKNAELRALEIARNRTYR